MSMTDLLELFKAKREEIGTHALAESLGIADATVRVVCSGKCKPDHVLKAFAAKYIDIVTCTFTEEALNRDECRQRYNAPRPTFGATKQHWWLTCQHCQHKGE
jgi:hypothetical protein